ncbi:N-acetyltransferase 6 [Cimex lectularius]|uniref:N-acetyltransferase domain-containing protein n=1 Tax=Cimex lectularius TaxID=79782 RepID=A0A8I6RVE5_CIMLE|nr:N-acetyltransferase 6 [Cimex lectularius]XP_014252337.1 N-acetyltransferase 6 [Cimex lectularius]
MEHLQVYPVHKYRQYVLDCCDLLNSEWPKSKSARLQSLFTSCDQFPTHLMLLLNDEQVVGHLKLTEINYGGDDIMVESVVIHPDHRKKGWGKILMEGAEEYARKRGKKMLYLSTRGQEGFYQKLGYDNCKPILYLGFALEWTPNDCEPMKKNKTETFDCENAPLPPPLPSNESRPKAKTLFRDIKSSKTYMCKSI